MSLIERDSRCIWHPYTQQKTAYPPLPIARGEGAYLITEDNKRYLDLISSWWATIHGHAHPSIAKAIYEQALQLEHVLFAGATHEPAVKLAELLLEKLNEGSLPHYFSRVFYSDNGSTAVEVALKMAYQYWRNQGVTTRRRFLAFDGGYHGDTVGAMSLGKTTWYFEQFKDILLKVDFAPYPSTWIADEMVEEKEMETFRYLDAYVQKHPDECAALIIEPLIQGASGMRMCRPEFLQKLEKWAKQHQILIVYDEVMTGFGRTESFFAFQSAQTHPDILCMAKGLGGGFLPLAATVTTDEVYDSFLGDTFEKALAHGHTFTANPLGCAAGLASLKLFFSKETQQQLKNIKMAQSEGLKRLKDLPIECARQCGTIAAFEWPMQEGYASAESKKLQQAFLSEGLLLRLLGRTLYVMPPYCVTPEELTEAYQKIHTILSEPNL